MPIYQTETERLKAAEDFTALNFPGYGINKKQELVRLLYEISKRENISPLDILPSGYSQHYESLKKYLLQRRYPLASIREPGFKAYLPQIKFPAGNKMVLPETGFNPKKILAEKEVSSSYLTRRVREKFPAAVFEEIETLRDYLQDDYNHRREKVFIVKESRDFFKKCPCTKNVVGCNYHIFNLGFGCIFECTYCYLQEYSNSPGIILPANPDRFFEQFPHYHRTGMRMGTGEFTDSLALDDLTEFSLPLIDFFSRQNGVTFELKTKSVTIENLLRAERKENVVISWSLNPQSIIDENEFLTPTLENRLRAATQCVQAGYRVGFHFDPIILTENWEVEYGKLIDDLFQKISPEFIAWISLGTFRFRPDLKPIIEKRFPENKILEAELIYGKDKKLRYPYPLRYEIYKKIIGMMGKYLDPGKHLYLCMEETGMWKDLNLKMPDFNRK